MGSTILSAAFWTRFAARHIWQSINYVIPIIASFARAFRRSNDGNAHPTWLNAAGIENCESCDAAARIELVERLAIVGEAWCLEVLRAAARDESDPSVRKAIEAALVSSPGRGL